MLNELLCITKYVEMTQYSELVGAECILIYLIVDIEKIMNTWFMCQINQVEVFIHSFIHIFIPLIIISRVGGRET